MREVTGYKKGVNLGGWLSQCVDENYTDAHYASFISKADIDKIASWGCDHVRLPIDYNVIQTDDGDMIEARYSYIDNCIEWCKANNLKIVLDIHKVNGFVFDNTDCFAFFHEDELQAKFIKLWEALATRYGHLTDMVTFELLNEVTAREVAEDWNRISKKTIEAIRKIAPDIRIMVGGIFNSSIYGLTLMDAPYDENVVFTFHCYNPLVYTHQNAHWIPTMPKGYTCSYPLSHREMYERSHEIFGSDFDSEFEKDSDALIDVNYFKKMFAPALEVAKKFNVPLYCGEYGVIDQADCHDAVKWLADINQSLDELNLARAIWTYKNKDFGLVDEHYAPVLDRIVKYL